MKKCISFILSLLLVFSVFSLPATVLAQEPELVDISFREMEKSGDLNATNLTFSVSTEKYTQGSASISYTVGKDGPSALMVANLYRLGNKNNPVDITGATHFVMDLWVPTDGYFNTIKGDAGVNIDDADHMNQWGSSGGKVSASKVKAAFKDLKAGWNFIAIELDQMGGCTNVVDLRWYVGNADVPVGSTFYVDDVRFVNEAALNTLVADRNAAKNVVSLLSEGKISSAKEAYNALLHRERQYVPEEILNQNGIEAIPLTTRYTATFDVAGGSPEIASQSVYAGDPFREIATPQKEGFDFGGWYVDDQKINMDTFVMPAKEIAVTARWVVPVTVSFETNGAKQTVSPKVLTPGEILPPLVDLTKNGHTFVGWFLGETKIDPQTFTVPETDITLTARWEANTYYLEFDADGGYPANHYQVVKYKEQPQVPVTPIKDGYVFNGWYNETVEVDFETFTMPASHIILKAGWKEGEETLRKFGNVNDDTAIDAKDALCLLQYSVKKRDFTTDQLCYGNVNADEEIDAKDALMVLKFAVQKLPQFPCVEVHKNTLPQTPPQEETPPDEPQPDLPQQPEQPDEPQPTPVELDVNIVSFNIRQSGNDNELDGDNGWLYRRDQVMAYINQSGADVMCLQEVRKSQSEDITVALSSTYKGVYFGREPIANPEGLMTIYNAQKYELISQELFWLSETPDKPSKGWGANYYRICAVLILKEKGSGQLLNVFNVHLDHQVELSRVNGLKLVMERLATKQGHSIVAGDFNTSSSSGCYRIIADQMTDTSTTPGAKVFSTCQGFGAGKGRESGSPIDFIFVNKENTTLKSYRICNDTFTDGSGVVRNYSDHYAVQSVVTFTYQ